MACIQQKLSSQPPPNPKRFVDCHTKALILMQVPVSCDFDMDEDPLLLRQLFVRQSVKAVLDSCLTSRSFVEHMIQEVPLMSCLFVWTVLGTRRH